jgi:hypothetical protein
MEFEMIKTNKRIRATVFFLASVILTVSFDLESAEGSFDVFSGSTMASGGTQYYVNQKHKNDRTRRHVHNRPVGEHDPQKRTDYRLTVGVNHSFAKNWQAGIFVPFVNRRYRVNGLREDYTGFADTTVYVKHMFYEKNRVKGTLRASGILGLDLPTGKDDNSQAGVRLSPAFQLGTGELNYIFGVSMNSGWDKFGLNILSLYTMRPPGPHHYNPGEKFQTGLTVKYRFLQRPYPGAAGNLRLGLVYTHEQGAEKYNHRLANSGGHSWDGKIGWVHHSSPDRDLTIFYRRPLWTRTHGIQLENKEQIELVLGWRF